MAPKCKSNPALQKWVVKEGQTLNATQLIFFQFDLKKFVSDEVNTFACGKRHKIVFYIF